MTLRTLPLTVISCAVLAGGLAAQTPYQQTLTLSQPAQPATVSVSLFTGGITVRAGAAGTVTVTATPANPQEVLPTPPAAAPPGMHLLNAGGAFTALEKDNHVTIATAMRASSADLTLQVPASSSLNLTTMKGAITITGISGDLSLQTVNGDIQLEQVGGSILAHALHGKITATVTQLGSKPSAFSSLNGDIDLTLPAGTKANLRVQDDQGGIYLDNGFNFVAAALAPTGDASLRLLAARQSLLAARDAAQAQADGLRAQRDRLGAQPDMQGPNPPAPPMPPMPGPALGASTTGTLNGGGTELRIQDFRGNIYLHQAK